MSMAAQRAKEQEARNLYELKQRAVEYYAKNGVPQRMEEILNSTFYDEPEDVYGYLANFFEKFAVTPTVTKIKAMEGSDNRGNATVLAELYCQVKNFEKVIVTTASNNENTTVDMFAMKPEERESLEGENAKTISEMINFIENSFTDCLRGLDPSCQQEGDSRMLSIFQKIKDAEEERLAKEREEAGENSEEIAAVETKTESVASPVKGKPKSPKGKGGKGGKEVVVIPDEPKESPVCGCAAVSVVSQALCQAAAHLKHIPLYRHIAALRFDEIPSQFQLPLPMVTILSCGKCMPGKLNCVKEYMVVPKPGMPFKEAFCHIRKIFQHCNQVISGKTGPISRNVNELGALCPTYDRPETGLDLLQEAITAAGLTPGQDFHIALNCAGQEIFDYGNAEDESKEKGKYEVTTGGLKSAEDLADYWGDILNRYPSIIALIDPMRRVEREAWMHLCEKVSEKCYVVGDVAHHPPGKLKDEELVPEFKTSGVVFKMEGMNTVSDILTCAKKMEDAENQIIISASASDSSDSFLVDLAVGMKAKFIKLGAPNRGERICKYNHMLQLESQLEEANQLTHWEEHKFTFMKPPTPPPQEEDEVAAASPRK